jgi:repressor LexA
MEKISPKRSNILDFINNFIRERGYSPSVRDVVSGCGISSTSVAQYHLNVLEKEGYISRDRDVSRSIGLKKEHDYCAVPMLGTIAAGQPIPVPDSDTWTSVAEESIEVPYGITRDLKGVYALKVKGTSMIDALIDDGDIVVMQQANTAKEGETIAAWLKNEQEVTLKRIYHERGRIRLQPANKDMEPIYCQNDNIEVQGKVIGVIRKL